MGHPWCTRFEPSPGNAVTLASRFKRLLDESNSVMTEPLVEQASYGCFLWFAAAGVTVLGSMILVLVMPDSVPKDDLPQPVVDALPTQQESCLVHRSPVPDCQRCGERASARHHESEWRRL